MQGYRTFQCLAEAVETLGYQGRSAQDVRQAIARAAKVYNVPLPAIPVDLDAFDARWRGSVNVLGLGFRSRGGFEKWRSHVRGALKRALGLKAVGPNGEADLRLDDAWQQIRDYVEPRSGKGRAFGTHRHITLSILIERARLAGRSPHELDARWLQKQYDSLRYERRKGFKRALKFFNELVAAKGDHPCLDNVLPGEPIVLPQGKRGPRYGGAEMPGSFHDDVERFIEDYLWRDADPALADHFDRAARSAESAKSYRSAISWLVGELIRSGHVRAAEITQLADVCSYDLIRAAAISFTHRRREENSALRKGATSLHTYISRCAFVAKHWAKVPEAEMARLKGLRDDQAVCTDRVGRMGEERERFARDLLKNERMRTAVLNLPDAAFRAAEALLECWAELGPKRQMTCLRLGVFACQTAILLRAITLRSGNLRQQRFRGEEATLFLGDAAHKRGRISIPGKDVKNRRDLNCPLPPDCEAIVRRFLDAYRPLLVTAHPYGKNAVDSDFLFPGTRPDQPMDASVFAHCFETGVTTAGLAMTQHMCRHAIATLILYEHPDRLMMVADWLGIDPRTVRKHYAFLDTMRAAELGQQHMQRLVREARRRAPLRRRS